MKKQLTTWGKWKIGIDITVCFVYTLGLIVLMFNQESWIWFLLYGYVLFNTLDDLYQDYRWRNGLPYLPNYPVEKEVTKNEL